jgi:hypothetical protein
MTASVRSLTLRLSRLQRKQRKLETAARSARKSLGVAEERRNIGWTRLCSARIELMKAQGEAT